MKKRKYLLLLLLPLLMAGCGTDEEVPSGNALNVDDYSISNTEASSTDGDFIYRLVSEKEQYPEGSPGKIFAELEYTGEQDSIDIFHAASAFFFPIEEKTRNYNIHYVMDEPLVTTTLTKGQPLREPYVGSSGYSDQDDAAYTEFIQQVMNNQFPKGYYIVNGYVDFYTETEDAVKTDYEIHAEIDFKIVEK